MVALVPIQRISSTMLDFRSQQWLGSCHLLKGTEFIAKCFLKDDILVTYRNMIPSTRITLKFIVPNMIWCIFLWYIVYQLTHLFPLFGKLMLHSLSFKGTRRICVFHFKILLTLNAQWLLDPVSSTNASTWPTERFAHASSLAPHVTWLRPSGKWLGAQQKWPKIMNTLHH